MQYNIHDSQLTNLILFAFEIGKVEAKVELGKAKPFLSQNEAHKIYGRKKVEEWIKNGLVQPIKDGDGNSKIRIDRLNIAKTALAFNRGYQTEKIKP